MCTRAFAQARILRFHTQIVVARLIPVILDQDANRPAQPSMSDSGTPAYNGDWVENGSTLAHAPTERLGLPHRFESAYGPFSRARGFVRVLRPVVQLPPTMMRNARYQFLLCRRVAGELIGHDGTRQIPMTLEQFAKVALRGFGIAALLHQHVAYFPSLIDRALQVYELAVDLAEHLVETLRASGLSSLAPQPPRIIGAKFQTPQPDRLVRDVHAPLPHPLLAIAKAQAEAKVAPHTVGDNLAQETVTTVTRGG